MSKTDRLPLALLLLRLAVFLVMLMWTIDKLLRPEHAVKIFANFYFIGGIGDLTLQLIGALELALLCGFLLGFKKRVTYGAVLALHGVSTFSSFKQYLAPFEGPNLLFFAAWPMLAACFALYSLRESDTMWVVGKPTS